MSKIENFKNSILFKEIHNTERSDDLRELIEEAESIIKTNIQEWIQITEIWYNVLEKPLASIIFAKIASHILYHQKLLILIEELKQKEFEIPWEVEFNPYYYRGIFINRIKDAKAILRKLRAYILEETKEYTLERKQKDIDSDIGSFYKGWYII